MKNAGQRQPYSKPSCSSNANVEPPPYGKYYVYSSNPTLSHSDRTRKGRAGRQRPKRDTGSGSDECHHSHEKNIRTRGAHEFYNMMWDPSVCRGSSFTTYQKAEMERCKKKKTEDDTLVKRRKFPKYQKKIGGIVKAVVKQEAIKVGFGDMGMQTEQFLEERTTDTAANDMCTQVDAEMSKDYGGGIMFKHNSIGINNSSQTDCDRTCPFGYNAMRIQKVLSEKILEQSLLEVTEETEMGTLRKETRSHVQRKRDEAFRTKAQIDAQRALTDSRAAAMAVQLQESIDEKNAEARLGAALFSSGWLGNMISSTFSHLKSTLSEVMESHELQDSIDDEIVTYYKARSKASRQILDVLLSEVASLREAETAKEMLLQPYSPRSSHSLGIISSSLDYTNHETLESLSPQPQSGQVRFSKEERSPK